MRYLRSHGHRCIEQPKENQRQIHVFDLRSKPNWYSAVLLLFMRDVFPKRRKERQWLD